MCTDNKGEFTVKDTSDMRLDIYLAQELKQTRAQVKKIIDAGQVAVDGVVRKCHFIVSKGQKIKYEGFRKKILPEAQNIEFKIIHENEKYIIIDKPAGIVVHPAPGNRSGTLLNGLIKRYATPFLVHRLDKDTSGIMIVALNEKTAHNIKKQFAEKEVKKIYSALLQGVLNEDAGEISLPIKRSSRDHTKMMIGWSNARHSVTRFRVKKKFKEATLVEVYLLTGRTHQIRVHFADYGHHVVGDKKYGNTTIGINAARQLLHACQISFRDPDKGDRVYYSSRLPQDFEDVLRNLS